MPSNPYVNPDHLKAVYRSLDAATIRDKLDSGELTVQAREIAQAELAARGPDEAPRSAPLKIYADAEAPPPTGTSLGRTAMRALFVLYLLFLMACFAALMFDPPRGSAPHGPYAGFIGIVASAAAGFPWTLIAAYGVGVIPFAGKLVMALGETGIVVACWLGALLNLFLFGLYFRSRTP
jgi:hypothetical protein